MCLGNLPGSPGRRGARTLKAGNVAGKLPLAFAPRVLFFSVPPFPGLACGCPPHFPKGMEHPTIPIGSPGGNFSEFLPLHPGNSPFPAPNPIDAVMSNPADRKRICANSLKNPLFSRIEPQFCVGYWGNGGTTEGEPPETQSLRSRGPWVAREGIERPRMRWYV